jgi:hypothetical protein
MPRAEHQGLVAEPCRARVAVRFEKDEFFHIFIGSRAQRFGWLTPRVLRRSKRRT